VSTAARVWSLCLATLAALAMASMAVLVGGTLYYIGGLPCLLAGCAAATAGAAATDWLVGRHRHRR